MTVNLDKGQKISLSKSGGGELSVVRMGLGWQAAARKGFLAKLMAREIDLDASAVLFAGQEPVDVVFFQHLISDDGSVRHTGDNLVGGAGQGGDDEVIYVDLQRVPAHIDQIVFTVNSFTGQTFAEVQNAFCRLVDESTGQELARAYQVVLRTPRFRTAKSVAPVGEERRPERPKRTSVVRRPVPGRPQRRAADRCPAPSGPSPRRPAPDRPQRSATDRPHRRTKALAG